MTQTTWIRNCFTLFFFHIFQNYCSYLWVQSFFAELMETGLVRLWQRAVFSAQEQPGVSRGQCPGCSLPSTCTLLPGSTGEGEWDSPSTFCTWPKHLIPCIDSTQWWNTELIFDGEEINTGDIRWVSVRSCTPLKEAWKSPKYHTSTFMPTAFFLWSCCFFPLRGACQEV